MTTPPKSTQIANATPLGHGGLVVELAQAMSAPMAPTAPKARFSTPVAR